jgi:hypothetical protein
MAYPIYANDIGGIGVALANQNAQRDASSRAAMSNLMLGLGRMQQQQNLQQQQAMAERNRNQALLQNLMALKQDQDYRNRALNLDERRLNLQTTRESPTEAKEKLDTLGLASSVFEQRAAETGDVEVASPVFKSFSPERQQAILSKAETTRQKLRPVIGHALNLVQAFNEKSALEKEVEALKRDRPGVLGGLASLVSPQMGMRVAARSEASKRLEASNKRLAELTKLLAGAPSPGSPQAEGLLQRNAETGAIEIAAPIPDWWKRERSLPIAPGQYGVLPQGSRQLRMLTDTATNAPAPVPVAPLITAPPPPMTGTNRPPLPRTVKQNGVVFQLMPDGSYQPVP